MAVDPDDEALTWGSETDPTHVDAPYTAVVEDDFDEDDEPGGMSSALLVTFGVFGGINLLFVVGWLLALQGFAVTGTNPFIDFMTRLGDVLAILSPAAWFAGGIYLTRDRPSGIRILWLLVGLVVVAPWPFILAIGVK